MLGTAGVRVIDVRSGMTGSVGYRVGHVPGAALLGRERPGRPRGQHGGASHSARRRGGPVRTARHRSRHDRRGLRRRRQRAGGPALLRPRLLRPRPSPRPERRSGEVATRGPAGRERGPDGRAAALRAAASPRAGRDGRRVRARPRQAGCLPDRRAEPGRVQREGSGLGPGRPHSRRGERRVDVDPERGRHLQGRRRPPGALRAAGVRPERTALVYCGSGDAVRAGLPGAPSPRRPRPQLRRLVG